MDYVIYADDPVENDASGLQFYREIYVPTDQLNEDDGTDDVYVRVRFVPGDGAGGDLRANMTAISGQFGTPLSWWHHLAAGRVGRYGPGPHRHNGFMVGFVTEIADCAAESSPWSPRETELLAVTLRLLQQEGYEGLTLDAVAATARASKATVYRRWPTKAELVLAAFIEGVRQVAVAPETGTLRGDLMQLAEVCCDQAREHASTMRAVLVEVSRNPALNDVMQHQFLDQRKALFDHVLAQAVDRGEIDAAAITDDLWDVMPGYLIFRSIWSARPPTRRTVQALVDDVMIPSLTRRCR